MNLTEIVTYLYNNKLYRDIKLSQNIQFESIDKARNNQEEKFVKLIDHAKNNVPYYSDKLNSIKQISDLSKVEFLTKKKIGKYREILKAVNIDKNRFIDNSTSGSTGESMHFFSDAENTYSKAVKIRGDSWAGLNYGDRALYLWGAERDIEKEKNLYKRFKHTFVIPNKILSTYHLSDSDLNNYLNIYNDYRPSIIVSYPTPLYRLAEYIEQKNVDIFIPKGIVTSAETLFDFQRKKIEKVFKSKIFNRYGCREVGHIASECELHNGLHINSDRFVIEIVDSHGDLCKTGELGEIVITDLDNYVFPLIRYKIGDLGTLSDRICKCGRNLPLFEKIEGRVFDLIIGSNGNVVAGTFWTLLRNKIKGFKKFQVIQEDELNINVIVEANNAIENNFIETLTSFVKEKLGEEMIITVDVIDKIELTKTGKHRWIMSKISSYVK